MPPRVVWNRRYEPWAIAQDKAIKAGAGGQGRPSRAASTPASVASPGRSQRDGGAPYKVFTPYWRAWARARAAAGAAAGARSRLGRPWSPIVGALAALGLLPTRPDWAAGLRETWEPGEPAARAALAAFLDERVERLRQATRDYPAKPGVSRLSPRCATASCRRGRSGTPPRRHVRCRRPRRSCGSWSGASSPITCCSTSPHLPERPLRPEFARFPWAEEPGLFRAWARGRTGYPLVDAGMRELWHTGYMHNRVRMITASFLTKDLLIPWQKGAAWFWDTLCDADLANNSAWAGSGSPAAAPTPHPISASSTRVSQAAKFDPDGRLRPPLGAGARAAAVEVIHAPDAAPGDALEAAGVMLGETYPQPIVDHGAARQRALEGYRQIQG